MKKITLSVALLLFGGGYFANAQVGIGTPTPASSSMLDIVASDKGVLIPRVELTSTSAFAPVTGTGVESLMVYNTETAGDIAAKTNVTPGYYYWFANKWNRVINADDLDDVTGPNVGDVIYTSVNGDMTFQYWDGTKYETITFEEIVQANESKTTILEFPASSGKYYYISEQTIQVNGGVPTTPFDTDGTTLLAGVIYLDVPESVIKNFETILDGTTTILTPGSATDYYTVEEYIKYISSMVDGNVIYKNIATAGDPANFVFQYWDATANGGAGEYVTINLGDTITSGTALKTKDTLDTKAIYIYNTTTTTNGIDATTDGVALPAGVVIGKILSITVTNATGVASSVTDVSLTKVTGKLSFNIGTGMLYSVLPAGTYNVMIEFAAE